MDALVLAGGGVPVDLEAATHCTQRALLPLDGEPMIHTVVRALQNSRRVERIAVVGKQATREAVAALAPAAMTVEAGTTMVENLQAGLRALQCAQVLVVSCDIPLVSGATFDRFIEASQQRDLQLAYSVVRREVSLRAFPTGTRTYATLRDGTYTGGNAFILPGERVDHLADIADTLYRARKNPVAIARVLGLGFICKFVCRRLSIDELEHKMSRLLGCRCGAVEMQDASIAFDVDKLSDYQVVQEILKSKITEQK